MYQVNEYINLDGKSPYREWLTGLLDKQAQARILTRINRMAAGNLGDHKPIGAGVWELRIDWGPGYRVYYARAGTRLILLLAGGDKRKQQADIDAAISYWKNWQEREQAS